MMLNPKKRSNASPPVDGKRQTTVFARHLRNVRQRVTLYAFAMKFEPVAGTRTTEVTFECIPALWFNQIVVNTGISYDAFWKAYPAPPASRVTVESGPAIHWRDEHGIYFETPISSRSAGSYHGQVYENRWYRLSLVQKQIPPFALYEPMLSSLDTGRPEKLSVHRVERVSAGTENELLRIFQVKADPVTPSAAALQNVVSYVGVHNVGQGGCNAIYGLDNRPFVYYDFGRAKSIDSRPPDIKPCLSRSPTIILSHWDQDHYELAVSYPSARYVPWIVREGEVGTMATAFARSLTQKRVWPLNRVEFEEYSWGFILYASLAPADDKNDSGLALLVRVQDDTNAPAVGQRPALDEERTRPRVYPDERYVLMTGDAMCQHIPSCFHHDLDGIVVGISAVHHGSYAGMAKNEGYIPLAAPPLNHLPPTVSYSYGINRSTGFASGGYNHPEREAINAYKFRGYFHRVNTNTRLPAHPFTNAQNCILGWRRDPAVALAPLALLAIQAARNNYDGAVTACVNAYNQAQASFLIVNETYNVRNGLRSEVADAADAALLSPAYGATNASVATTNALTQLSQDIRNNAGGLYPTGLSGYTAFETLDTGLYNAAVLLADTATAMALTLVQSVAANDLAFPNPQLVNCEAATLAVVPPPSPVLVPGRPGLQPAPATTAPIVNDNISIDEHDGTTKVLHPAHGLATGNQVTVSCPGQAIYHTLTFAITVVDDDSYTIPVTSVAAHRFEATVDFQPPQSPARQVTVVDQGPPQRIVSHNNHDLPAGHQTTIAMCANGAFNQLWTVGIRIDPNSYTITDPLAAAAAPGLGGLPAQAAGTRAQQDFKEAITYNDTGMAPTAIAHHNHGLANNAWVTLEIRDTGMGLSGRHQVTLVDGNNYTINATSVVFAGSGTAEGRRVNVAYANERVFISTSENLSTISRADATAHGLTSGDEVTLANVGAAWNGVRRVTVIDDYSFTIPFGDGSGNTINGGNAVFRSIAIQTRPVSLINPGRKAIVTHNDHSIADGDNVTISGGTAYDGVRTISVIDVDRYSINHLTNADAVTPAQASGHKRLNPFANERCSLSGTAGSASVRVIHRAHGMRTGMSVTIVSGWVNGNFAITVVDEDHYTIVSPPPLVRNRNSVAATATGNRVPDWTPPPQGVPPPSDEQVRNKISAVTHSPGLGIAWANKAHVASAAYCAWRNDVDPATCANNYCAFRTLRRN